MSVLAPSQAGYRRGEVLADQKPLRYPNGSEQVMTRRGWWLVIMNFLVPGSAQAAAGNRRLARFALGTTLAMWIALVLTALLALLSPSTLFSIVSAAWLPNWLSLLRPLPLLIVQIALIGYAVLWVVLTIDTLRLVRLVKTGSSARIGIAVLATVLMVVASGSAVYASQVAGTTRDTLGFVFGQSGPAVPPSDGYYNFLLLGADSGEGRDSMRFDSISVVSVNADTGAVVITGIPRDMPGVPFSAGPMQDLYPWGFEGHFDEECGWENHMNHVRHAAEFCPEDDGQSLYPDAFAQGSAPGIEATKDAAEGILGIEIPYYVFLDMHGFASLIDALGGVEITVDQRLPKGGGPEWEGQDAEDWAIGWIEPGTQRMDGDTAQWYARSRYTTSDWDRMQRQRQLQTAMLAQFTPTNVLARFNDIAHAGADVVETDIPQSLLPHLVDLGMLAKDQQVQTIELTPDPETGAYIDEFDPDWEYIHELVRAALHPPAPEE